MSSARAEPLLSTKLRMQRSNVKEQQGERMALSMTELPRSRGRTEKCALVVADGSEPESRRSAKNRDALTRNNDF